MLRLVRILSTKPATSWSSVVRRCAGRNIFTLIPSKLVYEDLIRLAPKQQSKIHVRYTNTSESATGASVRLRYHVYRDTSGREKRDSFPPVSGFLYYKPGPDHAPIAGEVRFRIVASTKPRDFDDGHDLMLPGKPVPWAIPLARLAPSPRNGYKPLLELLVSEDGPGALPPSTIEVLCNKEKRPSAFVSQRSVVLHSLQQCFYWDTQVDTIHLYVAHNNRLIRESLPCLIGGGPQDGSSRPYTGSAMLQFVLGSSSTKDQFHLRVVKIIERFQPVQGDYDGHITMPAVGKLVKGSQGHPWTFTSPALAILHDTKQTSYSHKESEKNDHLRSSTAV